MGELERAAARLGRKADRELAAVLTERNELLREVARLELELLSQKDLLATLQKSQQTRNAALQKSRAREAALLRRLVEAGLEESPVETGPADVSYLGQVRAAKSLLGP
jgi:chorismate mutase